MLWNQCHKIYFITWPLANSYINDQFKNMQRLFSRNVNFRLNTLLHGALQLSYSSLGSEGMSTGVFQHPHPFCFMESFDIDYIQIRYQSRLLQWVYHTVRCCFRCKGPKLAIIILVYMAMINIGLPIINQPVESSVIALSFGELRVVRCHFEFLQ